ncbi:MAG: hypothetical protein QW757_00600 [Candidatus Woesearchaeota archaeon]
MRKFVFYYYFKKTVLFISLSLFYVFLTQFYFHKTSLFNKFLVNPSIFRIEPTHSKIVLLITGIIAITTFITLSYKKLLDLPIFKFRFKQLIFVLFFFLFVFLFYYLKYLINLYQDFFLKYYFFIGLFRIFIYIMIYLSLFLSIFGLDFFLYFIKKFKYELLSVFIISIIFFFFVMYSQKAWPEKLKFL